MRTARVCVCVCVCARAKRLTGPFVYVYIHKRRGSIDLISFSIDALYVAMDIYTHLSGTYIHLYIR